MPTAHPNCTLFMHMIETRTSSPKTRAQSANLRSDRSNTMCSVQQPRPHLILTCILQKPCVYHSSGIIMTPSTPPTALPLQGDTVITRLLLSAPRFARICSIHKVISPSAMSGFKETMETVCLSGHPEELLGDVYPQNMKVSPTDTCLDKYKPLQK
ncbi:hypothetical protein T440DRAFT_292084 [Plenodomus tracheiphilus IPT5]|uniref:Uncharacterized protein n=1 Tax=Plenodomus tracheiphilus IPT5 TaxID=1408161 RepID=A0A6A7BEM6_9PLEO|nr:hypothetical protein T440DRAFT_292084 [Plenodomus tracheiphilus IPT5]